MCCFCFPWQWLSIEGMLFPCLSFIQLYEMAELGRGSIWKISLHLAREYWMRRQMWVFDIGPVWNRCFILLEGIIFCEEKIQLEGKANVLKMAYKNVNNLGTWWNCLVPESIYHISEITAEWDNKFIYFYKPNWKGLVIN